MPRTVSGRNFTSDGRLHNRNRRAPRLRHRHHGGLTRGRGASAERSAATATWRGASPDPDNGVHPRTHPMTRSALLAAARRSLHPRSQAPPAPSRSSTIPATARSSIRTPIARTSDREIRTVEATTARPIPGTRRFWPFSGKSDIRAATIEPRADTLAPQPSMLIRRLSSAVEQRFCKPKVGGSIPSAGTSLREINDLRGVLSGLAEAFPRAFLDFFHSFQLILQIYVVIYLVRLIA